MSRQLLLLVCFATYFTFGRGEFSVTTFNADLSPTACPHDAESSTHPGTCEFQTRRDRLIEEIGHVDFFSDVICLQGIWYEKDALEIKEKLFSKYKYSFSFLNSTHDNDVRTHFRFPPPCMNDTEKLNLFQLCNEHVCYSDPHRMEFFNCLEHECKMEDILSSMSESCLSCLYHGTVQDNFEECEAEDYAFNPTGLLLLSKLPMSHMRREFYHNTTRVESLGYTYYKSHELIQRGYLDVNVESIGRVVCTQLTEKLGHSYIDLHPEFSSFEEKNSDEMQKLAMMLEDETKAIVLADMSASPSLTKMEGAIAPQFPAALNEYFGSWNDPVSESYQGENPHCTVCCGNKYVRKVGICAKEGSVGYLMDHVLLKGYKAKDGKRNPDVGRLFMGTPESSPLSPHYGVRVVVVEDDVHQGTGENDANNGDADDDAKDDDVKMLIARMVTPMAKTENNVSKSDVNLLE